MLQQLYYAGLRSYQRQVIHCWRFALGAVFNTLQIYDIATNTWIMDLTCPRLLGILAAQCLTGGYISYGGLAQSNPNIVSNITQIYDPISNTWSPDRT